MLQFSYSHIPPGILRKSLTFLWEFFENLSHSLENSSKISHIPRGILRKSLTFLGEFFENPSHSSGNYSKISHIPWGILRKSLTFLGEFFENPSHSSGNFQKSFVESLKAVSSLVQSMGFSNLSILVLFFYWKEIVIYFRKLINSASFVYIFTLYSSCQLFLWRLI